MPLSITSQGKLEDDFLNLNLCSFRRLIFSARIFYNLDRCSAFSLQKRMEIKGENDRIIKEITILASGLKSD
jgi:hypothetical protein